MGCLGSGLQIATVLIAPSPLNFLLCAGTYSKNTGGRVFCDETYATCQLEGISLDSLAMRCVSIPLPLVRS